MFFAYLNSRLRHREMTIDYLCQVVRQTSQIYIQEPSDSYYCIRGKKTCSIRIDKCVFVNLKKYLITHCVRNVNAAEVMLEGR